MNWIVFLLCSWLCFGLELGLRPVLGLGPSGEEIAPSFVIPLLVFVALQAPPKTALWAALFLGLFTDLHTQYPISQSTGNATIIGPAALGYVLAAQLVISARGMVIHRNPITHITLSVLAVAVAHTVIVAFMTTRGFYDTQIAWHPTFELKMRLGSALYTGLAALVVAFLLYAIGSFFNFQGVYHAPANPRRRGGLIS